MYSASKPTACKTRKDSGKTWFPMPSPGMVMTVYFAMITPWNIYRPDAEGAEKIKVSSMKELSHAQPLRHQILHSASNHQRLRHAAQRRERKLLPTPRDRA